MMVQAKPLVAGSAQGEVLRLAPLSFWGGVDPVSGCVTDPRHPQHGVPLCGRVVVMERLIGSSSGSSVLLELIAAGKAPAAIILGETDCIATLGAIVARAMGLPTCPVALLPKEQFADLPVQVRLEETGVLRAL
jgi:predicted aconitase with swiveling domain